MKRKIIMVVAAACVAGATKGAAQEADKLAIHGDLRMRRRIGPCYGAWNGTSISIPSLATTVAGKISRASVSSGEGSRE